MSDLGTDTPWLSVVMPLFNGAETLEASLRSLVGQMQGAELVAVDQGSSDRSVEILKTYQSQFDIRIISAPENKNWMQNTNLAIREASAGLVTMLHQDDIWLSGRTAVLKDLTNRYPDARFWAHPSHYIDASGRPIGKIGPPFGAAHRQIGTPEILGALLVQNTMALPSVAFRREDALRDGGLDETLWYTADWDFWLRLAKTGALGWSPDPLTAYRLHSGALTIKGSKDSMSFRNQLETPVRRHLDAKSTENGDKIARLAAVSNEINIFLAGAFHRDAQGMLKLLGMIAKLGPANIRNLLSATQLSARILPRIRLLFRKP